MYFPAFFDSEVSLIQYVLFELFSLTIRMGIRQTSDIRMTFGWGKTESPTTGMVVSIASCRNPTTARSIIVSVIASCTEFAERV